MLPMYPVSPGDSNSTIVEKNRQEVRKQQSADNNTKTKDKNHNTKQLR